MPSKNLWGDLESLKPFRTPTTVLKEQAGSLSSATNGVLRGKVGIDRTTNRFEIVLSIVAPALNNYEFNVVYVRHGIEVYPADVKASYPVDKGGNWLQCKTEDALVIALASILGSAKVKRVIQSLVSQSKAM